LDPAGGPGNRLRSGRAASAAVVPSTLVLPVGIRAMANAVREYIHPLSAACRKHASDPVSEARLLHHLVTMAEGSVWSDHQHPWRMPAEFHLSQVRVLPGPPLHCGPV